MNVPLAHLPESRRWRQQSYPVPVVAALIRRTSTVPTFLLIRRIHPPYAGQWALVGGKWDFGESLAETIMREVWEETGVPASFIAVRGCVNERMVPGTPHDLGAHFLIFVCELDASQAEPSEQNEGQVAWFTESQLDEMNNRGEVAPTDYRILKHFLAENASISYIEAEIVTHGEDMLSSSVRRFSSEK